MPPPPPPPPPGAPPPPSLGGLKAPPKSSGGGGQSRGALLNSIQAGAKLKSTKHLMVDKSGPALGGRFFTFYQSIHKV